ncbi:transcriptional repressor LexA [Salinisphaera sp. P385]|uniref:LexA repressor n=1 Tax=Spectribacter acetivorans TaxID=3075603 RepID=A0ABU3B661_9GAMM|nr:transcriptional repressor LexA [Salinisphaera sp. P385]MDT0617946.1 transcriptional repressor LexA [Salinisphaera sp. P385]
MLDLTDRQAAILGFIRDTLAERGIPPTRAEIMDHFGFASPNAAQAHLRALARRGAIELSAGHSRGIRLSPQVADPDTLPLIGRVAAGAPILAVENIETHHRIAPALFRPRADYLLRVCGDSMIDAGIRDDDLLAVHATREAANGQVVVARVDDEVTVKRFRRRGNIVELLPANPAYEPIVVDGSSQSLAIEGRAVGVIRRDDFSDRP